MAKLIETAALVTEVVGDTKTLFELQLKLLRAEIQELAAFGKHFVLLLVISLAALIPAVFFLGLALGSALATSADLPSWACHLIVAAVMVAVGLLAGTKAMNLLHTRNGKS